MGSGSMIARPVGVLAVLTISAATVAAGMPTAASAAARPTTSATTVPLSGQAAAAINAGSQTGAQIMARDAAALSSAAARPLSWSPRANRSSLRQNPSSKNLAASSPPQPAPRSPQPNLPQPIGTQFQGAQLSDSGSFPPDSMGTVGPSQFVVLINGRIRSFNKVSGTTDGGINASTDSFFGRANTTDPRIRYDRLSGRWFFTMLDIPSGTGAALTNRLMVGYSDTNTISVSSIFNFFFVNTGTLHPGCGLDYDTLGIDRNALYIGANLFCGTMLSNLLFSGTEGLVWSKAALLAHAPTVTDFHLAGSGANCPTPGTGDDGVYTAQGVDNPDPNATIGFFAGVSVCFFGELVFATITNPGSATPAASLQLLAVPATFFPETVPAKGSTHPLDALDDRLFNAQLRSGHLWAAQNICVDTTGNVSVDNACDPGNRDAIRWYDLTGVGTAPSLNQSGTVFDATVSNPRFYWMPSINVSGQGHVAMGGSVAGGAEDPEAAAMGRLANDALGTMQAATVYQTSTFDYNGQASPAGGVQRWGDYSYTSVDPNDDMTMWTIQEYANGTTSWAVEAAKLIAPPPATPSATDGTVIFTNQCSQVIKVTGTSTSGSGFFDPGAGFANHLTASVSGGVTVNRVTYIDPTHINLDISTQGTATGLKNVTVTNPDGQSVTGLSVLNVTGPSTNPDTGSAVSTSQYTLQNSDGATWQEIDQALRIACAPTANQSTLLTANVDLFTGNAGFNQDIGIFVTDNGGADQLVAWKESGGFAGTFSPNAAYVQYLFPMLSGHSYVFKLEWKTNRNAPGSTIYAGAGPGPAPFSPTSLVAETFPTGAAPNFAVSTSQYTLSNNNGSTWVPIDGINLQTTIGPGVTATAVLGANVDLFTGTAGFNQDIGIFVNIDANPDPNADTLVAWKESGGFAGTFSPNAAFVKSTFTMTSGHAYKFILKWKTNKNAPGATIFAAAGPGPAPFSPTTLVAQQVTAANSPHTASTFQSTLANSDGVNWQFLNNAPGTVSVTPGTNANAIIGANADLFTGNAGFNQDIALFVNVDGAGYTLVAWKESGGFAGTFSPNAAFSQATYEMLSGHTYVFTIKWKTNKNAPGATIFAAAGPGPAPYSPTTLTVELTN